MKPFIKFNSRFQFSVNITKIIISIVIALYIFILPSLQIISLISSSNLKNGKIDTYYFQFHQKLSQRYDGWLVKRIASGKASEVSTQNVTGTEWPLFGTALYLWTTESLQAAWEKDHNLSTRSPKEYAADTIKNATQLIVDPNQATWVKTYWGDKYLEEENLFYRMLLISGLTSYQKLSGDNTYEDQLRSQVTSLAKEIDNSPHGLLDDYPGECYPVDILPAIVAIKKADLVLGTNHEVFLEKAKRAFQAKKLDPLTQLPTYYCNSKTGEGIGPSRGVGIAYMLIWAPEIWPDISQSWYKMFENEYWQKNWFITGWREFAKNANNPEWSFSDADAGPIVAGYGTGASAFGLGAAIVNGSLGQASALRAETLAVIWPLPNYSFVTPKLLSNLSDAPFLGESALLFILTREPKLTNPNSSGGNIPGVVFVILFCSFSAGLILLSYAIKNLKLVLSQWKVFSKKKPK